MQRLNFDWDEKKERHNLEKHGVSFTEAMQAFYDPHRLILEDEKHSNEEERYFCYGVVNGEVMTVRFTPRKNIIRIIGAAYWREGKNAMKKKTKKIVYEKNPWPEVNASQLKVIDDFLPKPWQLAQMEKKTKVTITLGESSVDFFRKQAKKHGVSYQAMIRNLLQQYAMRADRLDA